MLKELLVSKQERRGDAAAEVKTGGKGKSQAGATVQRPGCQSRGHCGNPAEEAAVGYIRDQKHSEHPTRK